MTKAKCHFFRPTQGVRLSPASYPSWKNEVPWIQQPCSKWIFSYLCNRKQYVVLNGKQSSVLSGLRSRPFFFIYINDAVHEALDSHTHIILYADDILLHRVISSTADYSMDINTFSSWVTSNSLLLYVDKCKLMVTSRLRKKSATIVSQWATNGKSLILQIPRDYQDLSWSTHINEISRKSRKLIGMLYRQFYIWMVNSWSSLLLGLIWSMPPKCGTPILLNMSTS